METLVEKIGRGNFGKEYNKEPTPDKSTPVNADTAGGN